MGGQIAGALETGFALPLRLWSAAFPNLGGNIEVTGQPVAGDIDARGPHGGICVATRGNIAVATPRWRM